MKKRILALMLVGAVVSSFAACGNESAKVEEDTTAPVAEQPEIAEEISEDTDANVEVEVVEGFTHTPEYEEALANAVLYGNTDGKSYDDYKSAYASAIDDLEENLPEYSFTYALAYINEDDVPELLCNSSNEDFGVYLISYYEGSLYMASTNGLDFSYIEKKNVINNEGELLGAYYNNLLAIRDGQWVLLGYGERGTSYPWAEDSFDENGDPIIDMWTWDDDSLKNSTEYEEKLALFFDENAAKTVDSYVSKEDILTQIEEL